MAESLSRFSMVFASSRAASHSAASHELCSQGVCRVILIVQYTKSNMGGESKKINRYWIIWHSIMQLHITYQDIPRILILFHDFHVIFLLPNIAKHCWVPTDQSCCRPCDFAPPICFEADPKAPVKSTTFRDYLINSDYLNSVSSRFMDADHGRSYHQVGCKRLQWSTSLPDTLKDLQIRTFDSTKLKMNKAKLKNQEGIERPWVRPSASCHDVAKLPTLV